MSMLEQITADMKDAMRNKDKVALTAIRALKTAITNLEKDTADGNVDEGAIAGLIRKQIKQRNDSVEQYEAAGRPELAETEKAEIAVLEKYLPKPLTEEEINQLVAEAKEALGATSRADMGKMMNHLKETTGGRADGKVLSQAVMKALS